VSYQTKLLGQFYCNVIPPHCAIHAAVLSNSPVNYRHNTGAALLPLGIINHVCHFPNAKHRTCGDIGVIYRGSMRIDQNQAGQNSSNLISGERHIVSAAPVVCLKNIHKKFGALEVLRGIDLEAGSGDVISLIGSSGSGKSTLLRCTNLLEYPQQGEVIFEGEAVRWKGSDWSRKPADFAQVRKLRTNLAMVFQQFNLWAHLTILQNVTEAPVTVLGRDMATAQAMGQELLEKVGIGDKAQAYPSQLSGGQQQRAAIARALAMEPKVMLFDEPTSALDPELEAEVVRVIKSLAREGRTMIIVTHDMKLARDVANHVIFLHKGLIEEQGEPDTVFENPKSERLRQFLSATASV
jgi:polar amino acid transport system ATP-binding protein